MNTATPSPVQVEIEAEHAEERALLERILASRHFVKSGLLSRFLRYICERALAGSCHALTEHHIGVQVFGRSEGYDCSVDKSSATMPVNCATGWTIITGGKGVTNSSGWRFRAEDTSQSSFLSRSIPYVRLLKIKLRSLPPESGLSPSADRNHGWLLFSLCSSSFCWV